MADMRVKRLLIPSAAKSLRFLSALCAGKRGAGLRKAENAIKRSQKRKGFAAYMEFPPAVPGGRLFIYSMA
jgi:hypothetical protein